MNSYIAIVILSWNGWADTIECLESIYQIEYSPYVVIVVDNGSTDNTILRIKEWANGSISLKSKYITFNPNLKPIKIFQFSKKESDSINIKQLKQITNLSKNEKILFLIACEKNFGPTKGANIGLKFSLKLSPDFILFMNNDTVVDPHFLTKLVDVAKRDKQIGLISPFIYSYNNPNEIQSCGERISAVFIKSKKVCDEKNPADVVDSDMAVGSCMLISKETIAKIGLFPSDFPVVLADVAYSLEAKAHGLKIKFVRDSKIWHKKSRSTSKLKNEFIRRKTRENMLFRFYFFKKPYFLIGILFRIFVYYPLYSLKMVLNKNFDGVRSLWRGLIEGLYDIAYKKRLKNQKKQI